MIPTWATFLKLDQGLLSSDTMAERFSPVAIVSERGWRFRIARVKFGTSPLIVN